MPSKRAKTKRKSGHTAECTKKSLYFQNSQLAEIDKAIERIRKKTGLPVSITFTSIVQRAVEEWLTKEKYKAEADGMFS
jgi:hypothetical protein